MSATAPLVVITDCQLPADGLEPFLRDAGLRVRRADCETPADVLAAAADAAAMIVQWAPVPSSVLEGLTHLRIVSRMGIGYDMIDVGAATSLGIAVANTPSYCLEEVAAHTMALALSGLRRIAELDGAVRGQRWFQSELAHGFRRPSSSTFGIIGFGRIGARVARAAAALGFVVVVHDPYVPDEAIRAAGYLPANLEEALSRSDVLTLHAPLTPETHHLIDARALGLLKPGCFLVNTCRGGLVDEAALAQSLQNGHPAGAGLDVFEQEPLPSDSALLELTNVYLTPHAAWCSSEALRDLPRQAAQHVVDFLAGREVGAIVNPEYDSPERF